MLSYSTAYELILLKKRGRPADIPSTQIPVVYFDWSKDGLDLNEVYELPSCGSHHATAWSARPD